MFNREGVTSVSTNHIADEMDISPGNLYYHFRNKGEIVQELFDRFRHRMDEILLASHGRAMDLEDTWFYFHLVFEAVHEYRFLYRNLVDLTQNDRSLRIHLNHLLRQQVEGARALLDGLAQAGILAADDVDREATAVNIVVLTTYWLNFSMIRDREFDGPMDLGQAVYQIFALVAPLLREPQRSQLRLLAERYL